MLAQMIAQKNSRPATEGDGSLRIIGPFFRNDIPEKSRAVQRTADVDKLGGRATRFQMSAGSKCLTTAMPVVDHEGKRAKQESGGRDCQMTTVGHFPHFAPKD